MIIGSGPLHNSLQQKVNKYKMSNKVLLLGEKLHDEIADWMNASDLLVLPSIKESFGVVQLEAMACGKPVVATRNGGSEEVIVSDDLGFLCNNQDISDMATKILLALDKNWDHKIIHNHTTKYTWSNICKQIAEEYLKCLDI